MATFNRMIVPPEGNSREMRAYMQAVLEVTGMMAGQNFPLGLFMENFETHLKPKHSFPYAVLNKLCNLYTLTHEGVRFFSSRLTPNPIVKGQKVSRDEVMCMARKILHPDAPEGWEAFEVNLPDNH